MLIKVFNYNYKEELGIHSILLRSLTSFLIFFSSYILKTVSFPAWGILSFNAMQRLKKKEDREG